LLLDSVPHLAYINMHGAKILLVLSFLRFSTAGSSVDFHGIPQCAQKSCFPFHSSSIGCSSFTTECFCTQSLAPLKCAYQSCNDTEWFAVQDWFAGICPNPPVVDFQVVPGCGRACLRSELDSNGCPPVYSDNSGVNQYNRNCFCRLASNGMQQSCLTSGCNETASDVNTTLTLFYGQNCVYVQNNAYQSDPQPTADQVIQSASGSGSSVDSLGTMLGIPASIVGLLVFIGSMILWFRRARRHARETGNWTMDPPPPYSK